MTMINNNKIYIDALAYYNYIKLYIQFEDLIKKLFANSIVNLNGEALAKWWYYIGFLVSGEKFIDKDEAIIHDKTNQYFPGLVNKLTINNILRVCNFDNTLFESLTNMDIDLIQNSRIKKKVHECARILCDMRNVIAHETDYSQSSKLDKKPDDYVIEVLSHESFNANKLDWMNDITYDETGNQTRMLLYNCIYLDILINKINYKLNEHNIET